jgi:hypothetical protein
MYRHSVHLSLQTRWIINGTADAGEILERGTAAAEVSPIVSNIVAKLTAKQTGRCFDFD